MQKKVKALKVVNVTLFNTEYT